MPCIRPAPGRQSNPQSGARPRPPPPRSPAAGAYTCTHTRTPPPFQQNAPCAAVLRNAENSILLLRPVGSIDLCRGCSMWWIRKRKCIRARRPETKAKSFHHPAGMACARAFDRPRPTAATEIGPRAPRSRRPIHIACGTGVCGGTVDRAALWAGSGAHTRPNARALFDPDDGIHASVSSAPGRPPLDRPSQTHSISIPALRLGPWRLHSRVGGAHLRRPTDQITSPHHRPP